VITAEKLEKESFMIDVSSPLSVVLQADNIRSSSCCCHVFIGGRSFLDQAGLGPPTFLAPLGHGYL